MDHIGDQYILPDALRVSDHMRFRVSHSLVSMVVADGLAPIWSQDISNHHDDLDYPQHITALMCYKVSLLTYLRLGEIYNTYIAIWGLIWGHRGSVHAFLCPVCLRSHEVYSQSQLSQHGGCWWPGTFLVPGHQQPSWWLKLVPTYHCSNVSQSILINLSEAWRDI